MAKASVICRSWASRSSSADVTGDIERGLVDEILVHIVPVLLGGGTRFYSSSGIGKVALAPISATQSGSVATLRFRVIK